MDENPDWFGRIFECAVGVALCQQFDDVHYWLDGNDKIDFVVKTENRFYTIEVKSGRIRRTSGLAKFIQRYPECTPMVIDLEKGTRLLEGMLLREI